MDNSITISKHQRWVHLVGELGAIIVLPWMYQAYKAADEPHRTRLLIILSVTAAVDSYLLVQWIKHNNFFKRRGKNV